MATRRLIVALTLLAAYFGVMLIPAWFPSFGASGAFFVYVLSIPVTLATIAGLLLWGIVGAIVANVRGAPIGKWHRVFITVSIAGTVMFGSVLLISQNIRRALPTGSNLLEFDPAAWREPSSSTFIQGDITPRQKMLGSLVTRLKPGTSRSDIEGLLGPSLDTPYFQSTGRDLIYILGTERDTFLGIDSEWLLIWVDDAGRFERYEITVD